MSKKFIIILILVVVFGVGAGYFWGFSNEQAVLNNKLSAIHPLRANDSDYKFIDPLLAYIIPSADQESGMASLKNKINNFINNKKKNNSLSDASVFFYDLNRGRWIGINEAEKYNPASMLKVVMMVSYFKDAENNPSLLNKELIYDSKTASLVVADIVNAPSNLIVGKGYTVDNLINKMIIDSDNGATMLLFNNANQTSLDSIYNALNIENPSETNNFTISPRTYSLFFRILYSGTYLYNADSEKALNILSQTTFLDGLAAGLPKNVAVAHKFGEHVDAPDGQISNIELHDCGIIYYPKNPYLLCVMTKGSNLDNLQNTIKNISSIVYQNYSSLK